MAGRLDYAPVVDVRRARAKSTSGANALSASTAASLEAAKYASKATNLLELGDAISEFHHQVANLRFYSVSKRLSEYIKGADLSSQDLLDAPTQAIELNADVVKATAMWFEGTQEYQLVDIEP